jgi:peroxiredoxin
MLHKVKKKWKLTQWWRTSMRLFAVVFLLIITILFFENVSPVSAQFSEAGVEKLEKPIDAHDFTLKVLGSGKMSLKELRGKVILLHFFSVECRVCQKEVPSLDELSASIKSKDLVILLVAVDGKEKELIKFKDRYGITLPILIDKNGKVAKAYGVWGYHKTFFIDRKGRIVGETFAEKDWRSGNVKDLITFLLNEGK